MPPPWGLLPSCPSEKLTPTPLLEAVLPQIVSVLEAWPSFGFSSISDLEFAVIQITHCLNGSDLLRKSGYSDHTIFTVVNRSANLCDICNYQQWFSSRSLLKILNNLAWKWSWQNPQVTSPFSSASPLLTAFWELSANPTSVHLTCTLLIWHRVHYKYIRMLCNRIPKA